MPGRSHPDPGMMQRKEGRNMNWKEWFQEDRKIKIAVAAGILVIAILFLSTFWPRADSGGENAEARETAVGEIKSNAIYEEEYRQRILRLVSQIEGVGQAEVEVTLQSGIEYVYAKEESKSADTQNSESQNISTRSSLEQKTILVEDENGNRQALLRTTLEPTVRGVVVVCEGGGDPTVISQVTEAVKTAMGIGANQVCVAPLRRQGGSIS